MKIMTKDIVKKEASNLEDLLRYESAAVAAKKEKYEPQYALIAMDNFYKSILKESDPIIGKALSEAQEGLKLGSETGNPTLTNYGLKLAIATYSGKYEKTFAESKVSDLIGNYLGGLCNITDDAKEGILKYKDSSLLDLSKKIKDKETKDEEKQDIAKAMQSLEMLKDLRLESAYIKLKKKSTEETLEALYKKEDKKDSKKKGK